jgi:hypothetical protein
MKEKEPETPDQAAPHNICQTYHDEDLPCPPSELLQKTLDGPDTDMPDTLQE